MCYNLFVGCFMDQKSLLKDIKTYIMITCNNNYKERLLEAYYWIKENNICDLNSFLNNNIDIGSFDYEEITIFDRLKDESYNALLCSFYLELKSIQNLSNDYGDMVASFGIIGKTPYRDEYVKNGLIIDKTEFYRKL